MATKGKGIVKKMKFTSQSQTQTQTQTQTQSQSKSRSMNGNEFVDLNTEDISIALEYTGSPVKNRSMLLKVLPVDVDSIPTANIISIDASPSPSPSPSPSAIFYNLSLPVVQPILNTKIHHLLIPNSVSTFPFTDHAHILDFKHHLHTSTSGTLSFSDTTSHGSGYGYGYGDEDGDFSQSSDSPLPLPLPLDCNQNHNHFGGIFCQEEELSDDEHLERNRNGNRNNKPPVSVTFRDDEQPLNYIIGVSCLQKRTKLLCALLSLPSPQYPNPPTRKSNRAADDGALSSYLEKKSLCKLLLLGIDASFSEEERRNIKLMIQSNLYEYLGRLLEGRELFEDEEQSLFTMNSQSTKLGPSGSDSIKELQDTNKYSISNKLKDFSDSLIDNTVSSKLDMIFQDFAPGVIEELWNDAAIQATYSRLHELQLPRAANYFLDKAVEIAKEDYEPSDTDIMYAKGITSSNGLATMEFSFPDTQDNDDCGNTNNDLPDPITRYQLTRVHQKTLGQKCKWLDMFEDFGIVLFCVSLADYDEYDGCGLHTNKMLQSKRLFESVISHPAFKDKNFLLILNKFDLLEEKIEQVPLTCCEWFEDFNPVFSRHQSTRRGGNNIAPLAQRAFHYIGVKFKNVFKSLTGRKLYVCPVTGLESDSVDNAVRYAREIIRWDEDKLNYSSLDDFSCESIDNSSYS